jgi:hypothetical protein
MSHHHYECNCGLQIVSAKANCLTMQRTKKYCFLYVECDSINETVSLNGRWIERYEIIKLAYKYIKLKNNEMKIFMQSLLPVSSSDY